MNRPATPISEPQINPRIFHLCSSYEMKHYGKVSDTEQNSWQENILNDLYPHLIKMSARRKNGLIVGDRSIQSMIKAIHELYSIISILPE